MTINDFFNTKTYFSSKEKQTVSRPIKIIVERETNEGWIKTVFEDTKSCIYMYGLYIIKSWDIYPEKYENALTGITYRIVI